MNKPPTIEEVIENLRRFPWSAKVYGTTKLVVALRDGPDYTLDAKDEQLPWLQKDASGEEA